MRQTLDEVAGKVTDWQAFRELVAALADIHLKSLRRYSIAALFADTCIPHEKITAILAMLKEKGIVRESLLSGTSFFALSSRQLKEPLYEQLDLSEFDEKRRIREALKTAVRRDEALTEEALELIERWKDRMLCNRDHMGLVLASIVVRGRDPGAMLKKVETDHRGVNAMPLLRLLEGSDEGTRARTLDVLAALNDDVAVNTLLDRMNRETVPELRVRMAETIAATGKRNAILALMNLILDPKDAALKHRVLEQVAALPGMTARELLLEMGDLERDPETIDRIDQLLAMVEET